MPLVHFEQNTPEWLAARKGKITASIAAACLGENPAMSRQMAWRIIMGTQKEYAENKHQRWGHEHEADAAADYEALTGNLLHTTGFWVHPEYEWLGASPDRLIEPNGIWEGKCLKLLPTEVPRHTAIQLIIGMACSERIWGDYYVWHSFNNYFTARVTPEEAGSLIERLDEFRHKYVLGNMEPERKTRKKKEAAIEEAT